MPTEQGGQLPHCDTEPSPPLERSGKGINYWFEDLGSMLVARHGSQL